MKGELGADARMELRVGLSPRLRQALALLRAPALELARLMEREMEENPLLEFCPEGGEGGECGGAGEGGEGGECGGAGEGGEGGECGGAGEAGEATDAAGQGLSPGPPDVAAAGLDPSQLAGDGAYEGTEADPGARAVAPAPTLEEHLRLQLALMDLPPAEGRAAAFLVGCLDERGYLACPLREVSAALGLGEDVAARALAAVQDLDPPGVGARDLKECLLIQLRDLEGTEAELDTARALVCDHLEDLARGRLGRAARALGVTPGRARGAAELIRGLDPRPGERFSGETTRYVVPDLVVERAAEGWTSYLNDGALPRLGVSPFYRRLLCQAGVDAATRAFLERKLRSARWFLDCLERRRATLCRLLEFVVENQPEFLARGPERLRPLSLTQAAEALGLHVSTVSRAVAQKYVQTPHGAFPLRFFFGSGLGRSSGAPLAADSVKRLVQQALARGGEGGRPLCDREVSQELARAGIEVARRTVAKYRGELGIPAAGRGGGGRGPRPSRGGGRGGPRSGGEGERGGGGRPG